MPTWSIILISCCLAAIFLSTCVCTYIRWRDARVRRKIEKEQMIKAQSSPTPPSSGTEQGTTEQRQERGRRGTYVLEAKVKSGNSKKLKKQASLR